MNRHDPTIALRREIESLKTERDQARAEVAERAKTAAIAYEKRRVEWERLHDELDEIKAAARALLSTLQTDNTVGEEHAREALEELL